MCAFGPAEAHVATRSPVTCTQMILGLTRATLPCHFTHTRVISDATAIEMQVLLPGLLCSGIRSCQHHVVDTLDPVHPVCSALKLVLPSPRQFDVPFVKAVGQ